jgi:hypothetical protein
MSEFPIKIPAIKIYRGDSFSQTYVFKNSVTNTPKNLVQEGWTDWKAQWKPEIDSDIIVDFTINATNAANGAISISLTAQQTMILRRGVWDLQAKQNSIVRTWLLGKVEFEKDVTNVGN